MSIKMISWALDVPVKTPAMKLVLIKLADNANDEGIAWPSLKHIAAQTGLSERSIRYAIRWLEKQKIIGREDRFSENGRQLASVYNLGGGGGNGCPPLYRRTVTRTVTRTPPYSPPSGGRLRI